MSVIIEFASPEEEAAIEAQAAAEGLSVAEWLRRLASERVRPAAGTDEGDDEAQTFEAWIDEFPETPTLSDEALERESFYPGRP